LPAATIPTASATSQNSPTARRWRSTSLDNPFIERPSLSLEDGRVRSSGYRGEARVGGSPDHPTGGDGRLHRSA
jgi:hypothetical protein